MAFLEAPSIPAGPDSQTSPGPFSLHVVMCFIDPVSVTVSVSLTRGMHCFIIDANRTHIFIQSSLYLLSFRNIAGYIALGSQRPWPHLIHSKWLAPYL